MKLGFIWALIRAMAILFALGGVISMAMGIQKFAYIHLDTMRRLMFLFAGIGMIGPNLYWQIPGAIVGGGLFLYQWLNHGRGQSAKNATGL